MQILDYSTLITFPTFDERFRYLLLGGTIGAETFGYDRYLNQIFYRSPEWKRIRNYVIVRDNGNDLGCPDHPITGTIYIHHMNPLSLSDIKMHNTQILLNPNNLICVSFDTHNAIHYGDDNILHRYDTAVRSPYDMAPWKKG